jgi:predicted Zn-ribbon and HTH transcriptional regulator
MSEPIKIKKKRGRKSKKEKEALLKAQQEAGFVPVEKKKPKKRGRKPKGGKIIKAKNIIETKESQNNQNIILHLKCSSNDLNKFNKGELLNKSNIKSFDLNNKKLDFFELKNKEKMEVKTIIEDTNNNSSNIDKKIIYEKLKKLKINLRHNNVLYKRAACFWCTYEFDSPPIYIPSSMRNGETKVYGCFCSPECACSYLKNEIIDDSTRWERYNMLNNLYCKIYKYEKNIKPAPNPFYTLEKYYGNLDIEEYRKLLKNERLLMVIDKPLTKILPELHEENNELPNIFGNLLNEKKNNSVKYRLKRNEPVGSKKSIMSTNFNF